MAFTQSLPRMERSRFAKFVRKNSFLEACSPKVPQIVKMIHTKKANENVITRLEMNSEEPAIDPAVHIPATAITIIVANIRIRIPIFLEDFVSRDLPRRNATALKTITAQDAINRPAHIKKAA